MHPSHALTTMTPATGGPGAPPAAGTSAAGHSHSHLLPPGGIHHPQMQLAHHGPHGLGHSHAGTPNSEGQPLPLPPPGMPHPGPPLVDIIPHTHFPGPPFGHLMGHSGPMPPHGMYGPPPLMPSHGYTGPPRLPP